MSVTCYFKKENRIAKLILADEERNRIKGIGKPYYDVWNGGNCDAVMTIDNIKTKCRELCLFISDKRHARNLIKDKAFIERHFKALIKKAVIYQMTAGTREIIDICIACGINIQFQLKEGK